MSRWNPLHQPLKHPILCLTLIFTLWKALLLAVALASPGRGYDTSAYLSLSEGEQYGNIIAKNSINEKAAGGVEGFPNAAALAKKLPYRWLGRVLANLYRWDAVYFVAIAERGYRFEQEWAFGWGYTRLLSWLSKYVKIFIPHISPSLATMLAGVTISHVAHYVAVMSLYQLVGKITLGTEDPQLSFVTAMLHIVSPAGVFLSAPYAESVFAALSFVALNLYLPTRQFAFTPEAMTLKADARIVLAGLLLGLSSTIRSNGLPSGLYFLTDIIGLILSNPRQIFDLRKIRRSLCLAIGGFCVVVGFCYPQYKAYLQFCREIAAGDERRSWCDERIPSIYSYVQSAYWDVGLFRYWTVSNVPLFILAMPVMCVMVVSAIKPFLGEGRLWFRHTVKRQDQRSHSNAQKTAVATDKGQSLELANKRIVAIPQLALAILTLLSFHVQIINRISSGYPLWYVFVAESILNQKTIALAGRRIKFGKMLFTGTVMYSITQAGLFASFLPPA